MSELVDITKKKLTEEYERQKKMLEEQRDVKQALAQLEQTYNNLIDQIETMQTVKAPVDLIALYIRDGGSIWASKLAYNDNQRGDFTVDLQVGFDSLMRTPVNNKTSQPMRLPEGLYHFVVIAIPEPISEDARKAGWLKDDYGRKFQLPQ